MWKVVSSVRSWLKTKLIGVISLTSRHQQKVTTEEEYSQLQKIKQIVEEMLKNWDNNTQELKNKMKK